MTCSISTDLAWESFCNNNYQNIGVINVEMGNENAETKVIPKPSNIYISTQTKIAYFNQEIKCICSVSTTSI